GVKRPESKGAKNIFTGKLATEGIRCEKSLTLHGWATPHFGKCLNILLAALAAARPLIPSLLSIRARKTAIEPVCENTQLSGCSSKLSCVPTCL
ncbi:MAG: hypothetical protein Q7R35_20240, partial [Elusimicrobiota bacterium]|nr:hypothetical protein [Elusimicrobiota bacterium]